MTDARTLIESLVAAFNRGDVAFILAHVAEDCTPFRETQAPGLPYAGEFKGRTGATAFFEAMLGALEPNRLDIDRWVCEGEDVVAIGSWGGKARATGKSWGSRLALYFRVRDGKIIDFRGHDDTAVTAAAVRG
jgi:ketosteroid isomerase-like protein